jgi:Uma2 family endonuclease
MATASKTTSVLGNPDYPTSDGKPMAETDWHRDIMVALIEILQAFFAHVTDVYVSGDLLMFYVPGNKRRHVAPDVFVVKGVRKGRRLNYIVWEEGKGPDVAIEITSSSTRHVDVKRKFLLYQDVLKVQEYFLFDPFADYLDPPLQGYRLQRGTYVPIRAIKGRLPSKVLGLHLERDESDLRLFDPNTRRWLLTPQERVTEAEAENLRLRQELEELRRRLSQPGS